MDFKTLGTVILGVIIGAFALMILGKLWGGMEEDILYVDEQGRPVPNPGIMPTPGNVLPPLPTKKNGFPVPSRY